MPELPKATHRRPRHWTLPTAAVALLLAMAGVATAATYSVTSTAASGAGTLSQAILDANANPGPDTIEFSLSGSPPFVISPATALPTITEAVEINGASQPGYVNRPLIELNGNNAGNNPGLRMIAGNCTVRALAINRFAGHGIQLEGAGTNVIQGSYVGTDTLGTTDRGNDQNGIYLLNSWGNVIGGTDANQGNLLSGNAQAGLYIQNGGSNVVQGNLAGVRAGGAARLANDNNGISIYNSQGNLIGGPTAAARNILSGNGGSGVYVIQAGSTGNRIQGNFVGTDITGSLMVSNVGDGITIDGARETLVGGTEPGAGNLISANGSGGVFLNAASNNIVQGNLIGVAIDGRSPLGNRFPGVTVEGGYANTIGGTAEGARNIISANRQDGVLIENSSRNNVSGNFIGVDITGTNALGNLFSGVTLTAANSNVIGSVAAGNVISGNTEAGIFLQGTGTVYNVIAANRIGTDATGTTSVMNKVEGMFLSLAQSNHIGGTAPGAGNLISGNAKWGISLVGSHGNRFEGNVLGTAVDEVSPLPNGLIPGATGNGFHVIELNSGSSGNTFGGSMAEAGNVISYARLVAGINYAGIRLRDGCTNNCIGANRMFDNAGLAIDIGAYGVEANDVGDGDWGANALQNYPLLSQVVAGSGIGIRGTLNSRPNGVFRLQFFANAACDPVYGYGEGQVFLGEKSVTTGPDGNVAFTTSLAGSLAPGQVVTATATDASGNTSEFSACRGVEMAPSLRFSATSLPSPNLALSWTNTPAGFVLKQTDSLTPPVLWVPVPSVPPAAGGNFQVNLPMTATNRFYILEFE